MEWVDSASKASGGYRWLHFVYSRGQSNYIDKKEEDKITPNFGCMW